MMKNLQRRISFILVSVFILTIFLSPFVVQAALINCGNNISINPTNGKTIGECTFKDLVATIDNIIKWIISSVTIIFTGVLVWGGFLYMTSGDNPGNKSKAISMMTSTIKGFVIILCAWLIVYTIINYVVDPTQKGIILKFLK